MDEFSAHVTQAISQKEDSCGHPLMPKGQPRPDSLFHTVVDTPKAEDQTSGSSTTAANAVSTLWPDEADRPNSQQLFYAANPSGNGGAYNGGSGIRQPSKKMPVCEKGKSCWKLIRPGGCPGKFHQMSSSEFRAAKQANQTYYRACKEAQEQGRPEPAVEKYLPDFMKAKK